MSDIRDIEDLLIAKIAGAVTLKTCKSYAGELEKDPAQLAMRTPAVLVVLSKTNADKSEFGIELLNYTFDLLVVARNLRGEDDARRSTGGAYDILTDLRTALVGQELRADLRPLELLAEEAQAISQEMVIYVATYSVDQEVELYG